MEVPPHPSSFPDSAAMPSKRQKGGLITMPFILANEAFEKVASYGLVPNMIIYLMTDYKIGVARGTNILFLWTAATNFLPIIGAFLSDSYLGRFLTIGLGSIISLLGIILLWLTTMIPKLKPPKCNQFVQTCKSATHAQYGYLISAFTLMSIGAGGVRPCSLAFGADQIDKRDNPKNERALETFFSWYYASAVTAVLIAFTGIVYIQDHAGWRIGFGVPAILMFLSVSLFFLASPLYIKMNVEKSLFTSYAQVIVAAYKNRKVAFPPENSYGSYHHNYKEERRPTEKLRFLNKACIILNPKDVSSDGVALNPWRLCTIEQVEELKVLMRVLPLWSSSIMMSINVSQSTFPLLQANTMDRRLGSHFKIPGASFSFFTLITITLWVLLYDRVILPFASKIRGKPVHLGVRLRMGVGLCFSCAAMVVSAIVEHVRKRNALEQGFLNNPQAIITMSAMWLAPQHCLNGLAEAFNMISQTEFYYSEFPKSMSSVASALSLLGMGVANLLASVILSAVDRFSKGQGKQGWITDNINQGHYESYYWLLAVMSFINLFYFLVCSWSYGPCGDEKVKRDDEGKDSRVGHEDSDETDRASLH